MSRTGTLGRLFGHVPEPTLQMHPQDMARRGLQNGQWVQVGSRRGSIVLPVEASDSLGLGQTFMAMHWGAEYLGGCSATGEALAGVNTLMPSVYCPSSKQPELKHAAVRISAVELPWSLVAMAWMPQGQALAVREALKPLMALFPYSVCVPFGSAQALGEAGSERTGVLFRAAAHEAAPDALLRQIEALLGLDNEEALHYADPRQGQRRTVRLQAHEDDSRLSGLLLAGDTRAQSWMRTLLLEDLPVKAYGRQLLQAGAQPPLAVVSRGKTLCNCVGVSEQAVQAELGACQGSEAERLAHLQNRLQCGTRCGSCVPELKRMVRLHPPGAASAPLAI